MLRRADSFAKSMFSLAMAGRRRTLPVRPAPNSGGQGDVLMQNRPDAEPHPDGALPMARVTFIEAAAQPEVAELIERIRAERRGKLLNLYKVLLHAPALARTWLQHLNAVRWQTGIEGRLREIVIIRIAHLNRTEYVLRQHVPALAQAEGLSAAQCDALADWEAAEGFSAGERAALAFSDAMTRSVQVPDAVFEELRRHYGERQIVDLTVLIATYNMHNRVVSALQIDLESTG
jgi:4-carboxymuconolactone decarboxylase